MQMMPDTNSLTAREIGKSLGAYAADLRTYGRRGHPNFSEEVQEELAVQSFIWASNLSTSENIFPSMFLVPWQQLRQKQSVLNMCCILRVGLAAPTPRSTKPHTKKVTWEKQCACATAPAEEISGLPLVRGSWPHCTQLACVNTEKPGPFKLSQAGSLEGLPHTETDVTSYLQRLRIGRLCHASGLYLDCTLEGIPCHALVDTGANLSMVRPGTLPKSHQKSLQGWDKTDECITTFTGEGAKMSGTSHQTQHPFCLADIQDPCIIGLDLLDEWGAVVDVSRAALYLGTEAIPLHRSCNTKWLSHPRGPPQ